jgi:hypothetical protein
MDRETADRCFQTISALGCRSVHIGGGEPFLNPEGLYQVLESATDAGMHLEYVETNSSWCTSKRRANEILPEIKRRGINTLLLSISPFHNEYIPFKKVRDLMEACEANGIGVFPWTTTMLPDVQTFDTDKRHSLTEYEEHFGNTYVPQAMSRYGVTPGGTALETLAPFMEKHDVGEILADESPCSRMMGTTHFHVDLYDNYVPFQCPGLSIRLDDVAGELSDEDYPIMNALLRDGVRGLYELASEEHGFEASRDGYTMPCDLCTAVRRYLALEKEIESHELRPTEFYGSLAS